MENLLEVKELMVGFKEESFHFIKKNKQKEVLRGVDFSIKQGEIVGLVGESGCGKSTLAKVIVGMNKEYTGSVIFNCDKPQMVFQDPYGSLNPAKTIGWTLMEPLRILKKYSKQEMLKKAQEMLKKVGLDEKYMNRYPNQLSGGQRQRVCIGEAFITNPKLLVLDEPVSALDVTIQAQIIKLLLELKKEFCMTIFFISHDLRVVYQMCDRVMIMQNGRIVEEGKIDQVYFEPKETYTKILLEAANITKIENKH